MTRVNRWGGRAEFLRLSRCSGATAQKAHNPALERVEIADLGRRIPNEPQRRSCVGERDHDAHTLRLECRLHARRHLSIPMPARLSMAKLRSPLVAIESLHLAGLFWF